MRIFTPRISRYALAAVLAAGFACPAMAGDKTQLDLLADSQKVNKSGSDQSMQDSTTNAMTALMKLAGADRPGAISKGYQAFGQYRNSGDMDGLRLKTSITALKMDTMGNYLATTGKNSVFMAPISEYSTSYARLDPAFLHKGEAGKVADQFESQTGMKRETFLKKMATASDSTISASDPQMVDKVLSRFESFVSEIPNDAFRDKLKKQIDAVPQTVRTGLISQALQKASQFFAGAAPAKSEIAVMPKDSGPASSAASDSASASDAKNTSQFGAVTGSKGDDRNPATAMTNMLSERSEFRNIEHDKFGADAVGGALQTALDEQGGEDSIFKQVSRKYRSLSPSLLRKVAAGDVI
jgi:hypothetical protein